MTVLDRSAADDLVTSTLDNIRDGLTEQWAMGNILTKKLMERGNMDEEDGGNQLVENIEYQGSTTTGWVSNTAVVPVAITPILKQATFLWAVLAGSIGIEDHEMAKNVGEHQMVNLLTARINNVKEKFSQDLELALVGQVTPNTDTMWSLLDIVDSSDPAIANFGGIDRDTFPFWQATEIVSGSFATQGLEDMRTGQLTVSKGGTEKPDLYITTQSIYEDYLARLTPFERLAKVGDLEFDHVAFAGKPLVFSEQMTAGILLGINTKYTRLKINKKMKFLNQPFTRSEGGQSKSSVIQLMAQLTSRRPGSNFKLTSVS
jgi:hypothetical protein